MDFIRHPKTKILKIKFKITTFRKLALLPSSGGGEEKNTYFVGPLRVVQ
jgi:hypothetical protein